MNDFEELINELKNQGKIDEDIEDEEILKEINSPLLISIFVDKDPYIKKITEDRIINLTGQSGSGKTTYASEHFNSDNYLIIDTDEIFSETRFKNATGINKELGEYFRNNYKKLPNCSYDFDLIYNEIINYCKKYDKTIVIDCAQFHCIKDISLLKGTVIVIRTCIDNCYKRTIERFKRIKENYTNEEFQKYQERKKSIYKWYRYTNELLEKIDHL